MHGLEGDIRLKSEATRLAEEALESPVIRVLAGQFSTPEANTATAFRQAYLDTVSEADFDNSLKTNAIGPYWLTFAFLPLLEKWKEFEGGIRKFVPQVIMTSSMNGWTKDPHTSSCSFPYMYSKSAIGHATSSLAHELLPLGIRVNGIAPGLFPTEMSAPGTMDAAGRSHITPDALKEFPFEVPSEQPPLTSGGPPQIGGSMRDVGSLALFLVANWFVNGETVLIDGGTLLKHPSSY